MAVLSALLEKRAVVPSVSTIQQHTKLHKATIKSSLDFLTKEGILSGFGPKIDFRNFGYKLEVVSIFSLDLSQEKALAEFIKATEKDLHVYSVSAIMGSGTWNLMMRQFYRDVESHHSHMEEHYFRKIPGIYNLIRDRQFFYVTEPHYKQSSRTESVISLVRHESGLD